MKVDQILKEYDLNGSAIVGHGFASHLRDYEIFAGIKPRGVYRWVFTHCVLAVVETAHADDTWRLSWSDSNLTLDACQRAEDPVGYFWGVCWAEAYPGWELVSDSEVAARWSDRLERPMCEFRLQSNVFKLTLVFHSVVVEKHGEGTPILDQTSIPVVNR